MEADKKTPDENSDNANNSTEEKKGGPINKLRGSKGPFLSPDESASSSSLKASGSTRQPPTGPFIFDQRDNSREISGEKSETDGDQVHSPGFDGSNQQDKPHGSRSQEHQQTHRQDQQPPSGSQEQQQKQQAKGGQEQQQVLQPKRRKFWQRSGHKHQDQQPPSGSQEQQHGKGQEQARGSQERQQHQQVSKKRKFWKLRHSNNNNSAILPITNKPPIKKESMEIFDIALKLLKFVGPVTTVTWFYFHSFFNMMESLENEHMGFNKKVIISVVVALVAVTIALVLIFAIFIILMKTVLFFFSLLLLVLLFL